jgi:hypothetical protein
MICASAHGTLLKTPHILSSPCRQAVYSLQVVMFSTCITIATICQNTPMLYGTGRPGEEPGYAGLSKPYTGMAGITPIRNPEKPYSPNPARAGAARCIRHMLVAIMNKTS